MILIINICKEKLHFYEFVKPIEDILKKNKIKFFTRHYKKLKQGDLANAKKISKQEEKSRVIEIKKFKQALKRL